MTRLWYQVRRYFEKIIALAIALLLTILIGLGAVFVGKELDLLSMVLI